MINHKLKQISKLVIPTLSVSYLIFIGAVATDSQKQQTKLFIQQTLQGNIDFSIFQQTAQLPIAMIEWPEYEKTSITNVIQPTKQTLLPQQDTLPKKSYSSAEKYSNLSSCNQPKKLEFNQKRFYKWTDSNSHLHVSDRFPLNKDYHDLEIRKLSTKNFFTLNLDSLHSNLPAFASDRMKRDVNQIYKILIKNVGISQLNPITLNLKLFDDSSQFNAYKNIVAPKLGTAGGFYISRLNEATVYTGKNDNRMYAVTRHEATHAIINGAFGRIPTWLNEGLAEYFERLSFHNSMSRIVKPSKHHLGLITNDDSQNLSHYFNLTHRQWYKESTKSKHYALGWSVVYFLMSSKNGKQFLSYMLDHLAYNYCQPFSDIDYINQYYSGGFFQFEQNWKQWLARSKKIEHRY